MIESEFKRAIEELGFTITASDVTKRVVIKQHGGVAVAYLRNDETYCFDTDTDAFTELLMLEKRLLFQILTEYSKTPVNGRGLEKKYVYQAPSIIEHGEYVNIAMSGSNEGNLLFSNLAETQKYKTSFTDREFANLSEAHQKVMNICDKIDIADL